MSTPAELSGPKFEDPDKYLQKDVFRLLTLTCVEMAKKAPGDVLLHPGLVISDHYEHRVPEVLPVQVHRADEVLPVVRKSCLKS